MTTKVTVQIDAKLHAMLKRLSAQTGISLTRLVEDGARTIAKLKEQRS